MSGEREPWVLFWESSQDWGGVCRVGRRVPGPIFRIDLHLLNSWFKKEQLIHRRLCHSQAPGTFPGGELSDPCFCSWTAPWPGDWVQGQLQVCRGGGRSEEPRLFLSGFKRKDGKMEEPPRKLSLRSVWPRGGREGNCVQGHSLTRGRAGRPLAAAFPQHCHLREESSGQAV